jgi:PQQ-dependent catabolism-associated CXXCW motif protein
MKCGRSVPPIAVAAIIVAIAGASAVAQNSFGDRVQQPAPMQQQRPAAHQGDAGGRGGADLDRLMQVERREFGVAPTPELYAGPMHSPTPASIPGAQLVTTKGLVALVRDHQVPFVLVDVLGGPQTLPGAIPAAWASQPGSFNDQVQQQFGSLLRQATRGNSDTPVVFYCLSSHCWMSYNAALRAVHLGYRNVLWYRAGMEGWQAAGMPLQPATQDGYR